MKTFLSVSAALIAVPTLAVIGFGVLYVGSAGRIDQRERACVNETGLSRYQCSQIVAAEIAEEAAKSQQELKESSGRLADEWQKLTR